MEDFDVLGCNFVGGEGYCISSRFGLRIIVFLGSDADVVSSGEVNCRPR